MTGFRRVTAGVSLVLAAGLAWAQAPSDQAAEPPAPPPVSLSALVDQMVARFPQVEGDVVEVDGRNLTLSVGRIQGVVEGLVLTVVREGREIRHPRTGELLGHAEQTVGRATVASVSEKLSAAVLDGAAAQVGDRVRSGSGKARVTLVPLREGVKENLVEAVVHELYEGLTGTGRFEVAFGDRIAVWLGQKGIAPRDFLDGRGLAEAARQFKAEHILIVVFSNVDRRPFMDVRLLSAARPEPALASAFFVPSSIKARRPGQFSAADRARAAPVERKPRSLLERLLRGDVDPGAYSSGEASIPLREVGRLGFPALALDIGVPADGVPRVVVSDGDRVILYRIVDRALESEWVYGARHIGQVIAVYLVDLDGDGVAEVAVNRYDPTLGANALILSAKGGEPRLVVDRIRGFLVALDETGSGLKQTLWIQEASPTTLFAAGKVERATLQNGKLVRAGAVRVPESFRATGATTSNLMGKNDRALVYIDEHSRLRITFGVQEIYRSSSPVGSAGYLKVELSRTVGAEVSVSKFYEIQPAPLAVDLDGDGVEEVVVPQNQITGMLVVLFKGPTGVRFQQVPTGFEGVITGLGAIKGADGEPPTLLASVVRFSGVLNIKFAGESQFVMTTEE